MYKEETTLRVWNHRDVSQYNRTPLQSEHPCPKTIEQKAIDTRACDKDVQKKYGHTSLKI